MARKLSGSRSSASVYQASAPGGGDCVVGDEAIDIGGTAGADEAEAGELQGGWTAGEDGERGSLGVAGEVDQDIDAVGADGLGGSLWLAQVETHVLVDGGERPAAKRVVAVRAVVEAGDGEAVAVVGRHDEAHALHDGMRVPLTAEVAEPQRPVCRGRRWRRQRRGPGGMVPGPGLGEGAVVQRIVAPVLVEERAFERAAAGGEGLGRRPVEGLVDTVQSVPVAMSAHRLVEEEEGGLEVALPPQRLSPAVSRFGVGAGLVQRQAVLQPCDRVAWPQRHGMLERYHGRSEVLRPEQPAALVECCSTTCRGVGKGQAVSFGHDVAGCLARV